MIEELPDRDPRTKNRKFRCLCDCGKETVVQAFGYGGGGSCGCLAYESRKANGIKFAKKKPVGEASFTYLLKMYRSQAVKRGLEWSISTDLFRQLTSSNCHWCGKSPEMFVLRKYKGTVVMNGVYLYNGLDRVDSELGYTPGNVVPSCKICNRMKSVLSVEEFKNHIVRICSFSRWPVILSS